MQPYIAYMTLIFHLIFIPSFSLIMQSGELEVTRAMKIIFIFDISFCFLKLLHLIISTTTRYNEDDNPLTAMPTTRAPLAYIPIRSSVNMNYPPPIRSTTKRKHETRFGWGWLENVLLMSLFMSVCCSAGSASVWAPLYLNIYLYPHS